MSYSALPASLIAEGKGIVRSLWTSIKSNFTDHQTRINALEGLNVAPVGAIVDYTGASAPSGWLLCEGGEVSQEVYSSLYSSIGTIYNLGTEVAGNFRLPDFRGRVAVGKGTGTGLTARTVGSTFGTESHPLTSADIPSHSHSVTDAGHTHNFVASGGGSGLPGRNTDASTTYNNNSSTNTTGMTLQNTGSGTAHNNVQPSVVAKKIIKF